MKFQDYIVYQTREAGAEFFRYLRAVPTDKLGLELFEGARTPLQIAQEVAACPRWAHEIITERKFEWSEEIAAAEDERTSSFDSVDKCEEEFWKTFELYAATVAAVPDDQLKDTVWLPFGVGKAYDMLELADYPRWNLNYHTGQIAIIQMSYGDREMY